jgi:hypothetical protein
MLGTRMSWRAVRTSVAKYSETRYDARPGRRAARRTIASTSRAVGFHVCLGQSLSIRGAVYILDRCCVDLRGAGD